MVMDEVVRLDLNELMPTTHKIQVLFITNHLAQYFAMLLSINTMEVLT